MNRLDTDLNNTVVDAFDTDELGVDAVFQPGTLDREIVVIVSYPEDDRQFADSRHRAPRILVRARNDSTNGIAASEFEMNLTIKLPPRKGAYAETKRLVQIVKQNAAFVTYEVN